MCKVEGSTITSLLVGLEKKGLVERRVLDDNKREKRIYLTAAGREKMESVADAFRKLHQVCTNGLTKEETEQFLDLCQRVEAALDRQCGQ